MTDVDSGRPLLPLLEQTDAPPHHDGHAGSCCAPDVLTTGAPRAPVEDRPRVPVGDRNTRGQVRIPGGTFWMGDSHGDGYATDGELPVHRVALSSYFIDTKAVTNAQFTSFVKATSYVTDAERDGVSAVFHLAVDAALADILQSAAGVPWWLAVRGADWRHPAGPRSGISDLQNHPVVHVSWRDAHAYSLWAGKRLPTEAEWEHAARGGLDRARYPWGDELTHRGRWRCNIWQGEFPRRNTLDDGYLTTAPATEFASNGFGLHNTVGNVWEWCRDAFRATEYAERATEDPILDPVSAEPSDPDDRQVRRVMRGGSYLCHDSYCNRYRVAARSSNTAESSSGNIGFRCANDATT